MAPYTHTNFSNNRATVTATGSSTIFWTTYKAVLASASLSYPLDINRLAVGSVPSLALPLWYSPPDAFF
ncbi:hypothetical protein BAUCODRAFT_177327 [Baudoinia panamericana UAMH 10762]|uniref:Uncharacterized protein n=1 Tax=Baudoinia panamericana (strain UAMH 10762) TaxID=717646 RepID=M2NN34_BAUPA|nr:uncharacterized protein BAUCODRAFT_177327 [Baudoinia panamericana UAMH 10762]EMD00631.1 hypothetical protein BAUCODRAFT_177327 [Baudoinia panamericana UAMH 10762]